MGWGSQFWGERLALVGNVELEVRVGCPGRGELVFDWKFGFGEVRPQERALWNHLPRVIDGTMRVIPLLAGGGQMSPLLSGE